MVHSARVRAESLAPAQPRPRRKRGRGAHVPGEEAMTEVLVTDSITRLEQPAGKVIVAASHAGIYAAHLGALAGARAVILNDASVGRDGAGIGGLAHLEQFGLAAAPARPANSRNR